MGGAQSFVATFMQPPPESEYDQCCHGLIVNKCEPCMEKFEQRKAKESAKRRAQTQKLLSSRGECTVFHGNNFHDTHEHDDVRLFTGTGVAHSLKPKQIDQNELQVSIRRLTKVPKRYQEKAVPTAV